MIKFKNTIVLTALIIGGFWLYNWAKPAAAIGTGGTSVDAGQIEKILEMATAFQIVEVAFDTSYVSNTYQVDFFGIQLGSKTKANRLKEVRTWELKSGVRDFEIMSGEIYISTPVILSCEELVEKRVILIQEGSWDPVSIKAAALKSKTTAKETAIAKGLNELAKVNVELAMSEFNLTVVWKR